MRSVKEMMAEAQAAVEKIDAARAQALVAEGALLLDIRDGIELQKTGKAAGSVHVSRGLLEFVAAGLQRQVKDFQLAGKVGGELFGGAVQNRSFLRLFGCLPVDGYHRAVHFLDRQRTKRAFNLYFRCRFDHGNLPFGWASGPSL